MFGLSCISLVTETIPRHREYGTTLQSQKNYFRKVNSAFGVNYKHSICVSAQLQLSLSMQKLLNALSELEELKTTVQRKVDEINGKQIYQVNGRGNQQQKDSLEWHSGGKQYLTDNGTFKV